MNENEIKIDFDDYIRCFIKYTNTWYYPVDILDSNEKTRDFFKVKLDKLIEMLNEDDTDLLNMETDDIFDMLMEIN